MSKLCQKVPWKCNILYLWSHTHTRSNVLYYLFKILSFSALLYPSELQCPHKNFFNFDNWQFHLLVRLSIQNSAEYKHNCNDTYIRSMLVQMLKNQTKSKRCETDLAIWDQIMKRFLLKLIHWRIIWSFTCSSEIAYRYPTRSLPSLSDSQASCLICTRLPFTTWFF